MIKIKIISNLNAIDVDYSTTSNASKESVYVNENILWKII